MVCGRRSVKSVRRVGSKISRKRVPEEWRRISKRAI